MSMHLDVEQLDHLVHDTTTEALGSRWRRHLEECRECRTRYEEVVRNESLAALFFSDSEENTAAQAEEAVQIPPAPEGYEIRRRLQSGGQGVVYEALQKATGRLVALKMLRAAPTAERHRRRFEREIELCASLQHPNIVKVFDSGTSGSRLFYAMELLEGRHLDRFVVEEELPVPETLRLFHKLCLAVHHAHQRGVIHRDLKPSNVIIDDGGEPHVLDFGIAKLLEEATVFELTAAGEFVGTLVYAAPEQLSEGGRIDVRTDVYALGVILYELLAGRHPFRHRGGTGAVMASVRSGAFLAPREASPRVDADIEAIITKAMATDREERYQSAHELAADVQRCLDGEPVEARGRGAWYRLRKAMRRHRMAFAAAGATVLALVAGAAVSVSAWHRAARERDHAVSAERRARAALEESERLCDVRTIRKLAGRVDALWPIGPDLVSPCVE